MICDTCNYCTTEGCDKGLIHHQVVNMYGEVEECSEYDDERRDDDRVRSVHSGQGST